jgi:hypothetical protein
MIHIEHLCIYDLGAIADFNAKYNSLVQSVAWAQQYLKPYQASITTLPSDYVLKALAVRAVKLKVNLLTFPWSVPRPPQFL